MRDTQRREHGTALRDAQQELEKALRSHRDDIGEVERRLKVEVEDERAWRLREIQELSTQFAIQRQKDEMEASNKDREANSARTQLVQARAENDQERALNASLMSQVAERSAMITSLEASMQEMKEKINFLESSSASQSHAFAEMNERMRTAISDAAEAKVKLRTEETMPVSYTHLTLPTKRIV